MEQKILMVGTDLSRWNKINDYSKAAQKIVFALLKLTQGTSYVDPTYSTNNAGFKKAGVKTAPYHFGTFGDEQSAIDEAEHFSTEILKDQGSLPFVILDIEVDHDHVGWEQLAKSCQAFEKRVTELTGLIVIRYENKYYHENLKLDGPFWIASYNEDAGVEGWTIWQNTDQGQLDGIEGNVDLDTAIEGFTDGKIYVAPAAPKQPAPAPKQLQTILKPPIETVGHIKIVGVHSAAFICDKPDSKNSKNLGFAKVNSILPISGSVPGWFEVIYQNKRAYVNEKFARLVTHHSEVHKIPTVPENVYVVQKGDNLTAIALKFHSTVHDLVSVNHITNPEIIREGQQIIIPDAHPTAKYYVIQKGDTLTKIANDFNTNVRSIVHLNHLTQPNTIFPGQKIRIY